MGIKTINPATEEVTYEYEKASDDSIQGIAARCHAAYSEWRETNIEERARLLPRLSSALRKHKSRYAGLISAEMGKPISEAEGEVEKCAWTAEVYAENAADWLAPEPGKADGTDHYVLYEPLGIVLAVMPWNYPFWQVLRAAIPIITAGNSVMLKHASNVPQSALACEEVFHEAGYPEHLFKTIFAGHDSVGRLLASPQVQGLTLTGSTEAGKKIGRVAGENVKKMVLELGGSDPFIILEDADTDAAALQAVKGRFQNCGQSCIAAKRFILHESIADRFTEGFAAASEKLRVGDPALSETEMGPMVSRKAMEEIDGQKQDALGKGGVLVTGGKRLDRPGWFYPPTLIKKIDETMRVFTEETFGPLGVILTFSDEKEALRYANITNYGLGGSVWTRDLERGREIARRLECGTVFINSITKSDPRMPLGGVKESGIGRELGKYGLGEFTNRKAVNVYRP